MSNEKEKQFEKDLRANQEASDRLDKELNAPLSNHPGKDNLEINQVKSTVAGNELPPANVPPPVVNTIVGSKPVTKVVKSRKQEILEEYGGVRSNVPINHPEFWNL